MLFIFVKSNIKEHFKILRIKLWSSKLSILIKIIPVPEVSRIKIFFGSHTRN